jgi:anaerobic ribonucleoside-triphosphate reductase activating protein
MTDTLHLAHMIKGCETLGPGRRWVLWVTGCTRRCPGCVADPILTPGSGEVMAVEDLAARILQDPDADGVTFSGGEPFEQAAALAALCQRLRASRDLSLMSFSGFTLSELQRSPDADRRALLAALDILVDGPFVATRAADKLWRGSENQRVHLLTPRHADMADHLDGPGAGLEIRIRANGDYFWAGVPSPGFGEDLRDQLANLGIEAREAEGVWS